MAESTETLYRDALNWWLDVTDDPTLDSIDDLVLASFVETMLMKPGRKAETMSVWTVRKHCTHLQKLLSFAGPKTRDKHGRRNQGLLEEAPYLEKPLEVYDPPCGDFTLEEVIRLQAAADRMKSPNILGVAPPRWWRSLIVTACATGLRVGELMRLRYADLRGAWMSVSRFDDQNCARARSNF
ncbi:MAG: hypothetical protein QM811_16620 [Pirellulales bacterium]